MISFIIHVYFYLVVFQNRFSLVSIHNLFIDNFRTNIFRKQSSKFIQSTLQFSYTLRLNTLHGNEFFCGIIPDLCTLPITPVPATTNHSFFVIVCNFSRKRRFRLIRSDWSKIFSPLHNAKMQVSLKRIHVLCSNWKSVFQRNGIRNVHGRCNRTNRCAF